MTAWLPLVVWCVFAPRSPWSTAIAVVLVGFVATVRWTLPGEPGDRTAEIAWSVLVWYPLPGLLATVVTLWWTWRSRPRTPRQDWTEVAAILAVTWVFLLGTCGFCVVGSIGGNGSPVPARAELFPLPPGLHGVYAADPTGEPDCDPRGRECSVYYKVTGPPHVSEADLVAQVKRHLQRAKGWDQALTCRHPYRLLAAYGTEFCVTVKVDLSSNGVHAVVGVRLSMSAVYDVGLSGP